MSGPRCRFWLVPGFDTAPGICAELVTSGVTTVSPLVAQEMTRLAASAMLTAFPNTTMTVPLPARPPGRVPATAARRAADFIDGHLLAADPAAGHTVAAIARRRGFSRQDRFAAAYRAVYGRPPSYTLRS